MIGKNRIPAQKQSQSGGIMPAARRLATSSGRTANRIRREILQKLMLYFDSPCP